MFKARKLDSHKFVWEEFKDGIVVATSGFFKDQDECQQEMNEVCERNEKLNAVVGLVEPAEVVHEVTPVTKKVIKK